MRLDAALRALVGPFLRGAGRAAVATGSIGASAAIVLAVGLVGRASSSC